jgi:hypothetical protein
MLSQTYHGRNLDNGNEIDKLRNEIASLGSEIATDVTDIQATLTTATPLAIPNTLMKRDANGDTAMRDLTIRNLKTDDVSGLIGVVCSNVSLTDNSGTILNIDLTNSYIQCNTSNPFNLASTSDLILSGATVQCPQAPTSDSSITNKSYVDTAVANANTSDVEASANTIVKRSDNGSGKFTTIWTNRIRAADDSYTQLEASITNTRAGQAAGAHPSLTGSGNSMFGRYSGRMISSGNNHTSMGEFSLAGGGSDITGTDCTAIGFCALQRAEGDVSNNVAVGSFAGGAITTGTNNVLVGRNSLAGGAIGTMERCIGVGQGTLFHNVANDCIGIGNNALGNINTANSTNNIAIGSNTLYANISGNRIIAIGANAGFNMNPGNGIGQNTIIGDNTCPSNTIFLCSTTLGANTDIVGFVTNGTAIGYGASVSTNNTIQLGNTSVTNVNTSGAVSCAGVTSSGAIEGTNVTASGYLMASTGVYGASIKFNPATCTPLTYYEDYDHITAFTDGAIIANVTFKITRIGNLVTICATSMSTGTASLAQPIKSQTLLPTRFQPLNDCVKFIRIINNGSVAFGTVDIFTSGSIWFEMQSLSGTATTSSNAWTGNSGWTPFSISYNTA